MNNYSNEIYTCKCDDNKEHILMCTDLDRITKNRVAQIECKQCGMKTKVYANRKNFNLACTEAAMEWYRMQRNYTTIKFMEQNKLNKQLEPIPKPIPKKELTNDFPILFADDYMDIEVMSQLIITKQSLTNLTLEELKDLGSLVFKLKKHKRKQLDQIENDDTK